MDQRTNLIPPAMATQLFKWYCRPDRMEELLGDLEEFYQLRIKRGDSKWKADLFFWWNVFRCYKSYAKVKTQNNFFMGSLIKSYFKLALRYSWKNRLSVGINIAGLGLSLSLCVFVYMLYAYNIEFDTFYKETDNIYRIHSITERNGSDRRGEFSPIALGDKLRNEISGVNETTTYYARNMTIKKETDYFEHYVGMVSANFFDMFDIPLKYGSLDSYETQPLVYLRDDMATNFFGNDNPIGKSLTLYFSEKKLEVTVGGVFEKIPLNSTFGFDVLIGLDHYLRVMEHDRNDWGSSRFVAHFMDINVQDKNQIDQNINEYLVLQNNQNKQLKIKKMELVPFITDLHADHVLYSKYTNGRLRPQVMIIFLILASLVFFTACFNLANTSIGLIAKRLKEIGVRKTLGSGNRQILIQFLFEMMITTSLAFIVAIASANYIAEAIMGLFGASFVLQDLNLTRIIIFIAVFLMFTTLVAGLLPAFYAWKFQPAAIIKGNVKLKGINWLNKTLTVAQFGFSIAVLVVGVTFSQNARFLQDLNLGYEVSGVTYIPVSNDNLVKIKDKIEQINGVTTASTRHHFGNFGRYSGRVDLQIDTMIHEIRHYAVSEEYLELMEIELNQGQLFQGQASGSNLILVSQSFADTFFEEEEIINQVVKINGERRTIIGVIGEIIDDVYEDSELYPSVISLSDKSNFRHLVVKAQLDEIDRVTSQLKQIWSQNIDEPYQGELQSEFALAQAGRDTRNLQKVFLAMAILSGFLSIIGIFSLAKINIVRRLKEISIRKVLGASLQQLLMTINRPFALILLIALMTGCGLGYFIANSVLDMIFKYHVNVSPFMTLLSGLTIILMSLVLVSLTAINPLSANPVRGIRDE